MGDRRNLRRWLHDFQSPLGALIAVADRLEGAQIEEAEVLKAAVERLRALSHDLEAGGIDEQRQGRLSRSVFRTKLPEALDQVMVEWQGKLRGSPQISVSYENHLHQEEEIPMALASFQCLVSNLIGNAVDAVGGAGRIRVTLDNLDEVVVLLVEDDGCGIPEEVAPRVTEFGFSFNKRAGSGIGLWQVRRAIAAVEGSLVIATGERSGTSVTVELPRRWIRTTEASSSNEAPRVRVSTK